MGMDRKILEMVDEGPEMDVELHFAESGHLRVSERRDSEGEGGMGREKQKEKFRFVTYKEDFPTNSLNLFHLNLSLFRSLRLYHSKKL